MQIKQWAKLACCTILIGFLTIGLVSCGGDGETTTEQTEEAETVSKPKPSITEVAPPEIFQQLRKTLDNYQPQVSIISPDNGDVIEDTTVSIEVDVKDYPLFKREELGMGPHLHVILDNQPYRAVYNAEEPIVFEDLSPGTHTIRMFASRPWHESFKNEGAYDQVTFHLFTETEDNAPDSDKPLLTYSRPKGSYGAEPILLDYYLTNAPIQQFEQESDAINPATQREWRVRATINGESFIMDSWMPVHLKGFDQGLNWIKLELLDGDGNLIENEFNTAARIFRYQPNGQDTLAKLVRGELSLEKARLIVDQDYQLPSQKPEEKEKPAEEKVTEPEEPVTEEKDVTPEEKAVEQEEEVTEEQAVEQQQEVTPQQEKALTEEEEGTPEKEEKPAEQKKQVTEEKAVEEPQKVTPEEEKETAEQDQPEQKAVKEQQEVTEEQVIEEKTIEQEDAVTEQETVTEEQEEVTPKQQEKTVKPKEEVTKEKATEQQEPVTEQKEEEIPADQKQTPEVEKEPVTEQEETQKTTPEPEQMPSEPKAVEEEKAEKATPEKTATQKEQDVTAAEQEATSEETVTEQESKVDTTDESNTSQEAAMEKAETVTEPETESDEEVMVDDKEVTETSNSSSPSDQNRSNPAKTTP